MRIILTKQNTNIYWKFVNKFQISFIALVLQQNTLMTSKLTIEFITYDLKDKNS